MSRMPSPSCRSRSRHGGKRRLLLLVGRHPAEPHAKPDQVGAHAVRRLRPDPPSGAVVAAIALGVGRRQRGLADPAQAVQRGDGDAALVPRQRRLDGGERSLATQKMLRHPDRDVGDGEDFPGKRGRGRRCALLHKLAKA